MTDEPKPEGSAEGPNGAADDTDGTPEGSNGAADGATDELVGALQAAEATLSRKPEIDYLLVADRAEVVNGKLYLMGGSWDRIQPPKFPHRMLLGIALGVRIPFNHTEDQHTVAVQIHHDDKRLIGFEAKLTTGRPPGMSGMDILVPMAFNIPLAIPGEGQVVLAAAVSGREPRRHMIKVMQRPAQQQQGARPGS